MLGMLRYLSKYILILFVANSFGQDPQTSLMDRVPLMQNPGNTGMGTGYNRGNIFYRNQYPSIPKTYSTMYASADAPIFSQKKKECE